MDIKNVVTRHFPRLLDLYLVLELTNQTGASAGGCQISSSYIYIPSTM